MEEMKMSTQLGRIISQMKCELLLEQVKQLSSHIGNELNSLESEIEIGESGDKDMLTNLADSLIIIRSINESCDFLLKEAHADLLFKR